MGPAIDSLRPAVAVSRRNPIYLAAAFVTLVGTGVANFVVGRIPVVGELVNSVLVTPAFAALMLGMAAAGLATDAASFGDGVESLRSNYRSLVGAYAVLVAAVVVVVVAWAVEVAILLVLDGGVDVTGRPVTPTVQALATSGPVVALTFLALALVLLGGLAVQFFDVAIVVDGASAVSGFGASWRLFRQAPASVVGYSVLRMFPVVCAGVVVAVGYVLGGSVLGAIGGIAVGLVAAILVGPVTFAFITAYHVAYYERRVGQRVGDEADAGA